MLQELSGHAINIHFLPLILAAEITYKEAGLSKSSVVYKPLASKQLPPSRGRLGALPLGSLRADPGTLPPRGWVSRLAQGVQESSSRSARLAMAPP